MPGGTRAHLARHPDHKLVAQPFGFPEDLVGVGVEHDLQQPLPISQIDEYHPAVITTAMHPAGDRDVLAEELLVNLSAVM